MIQKQTVVTQEAQLAEALQFIQEQSTLSYDTETTGLNTRKEKVIGFGISNGVQSYYFVHLSWNGSDLEEVLPHESCRSILKALFSKQLVCWNSSFDLRMTKNYFQVDLVPALWSDGMLAFHTCYEEGVPFSHKPFSLKTVGVFRYGKEAASEQQDLKESIRANGGSPNEFYKADTLIMAKYCMKDAELTYCLNEDFVHQLTVEGLADFYFTDEVMPLYREVTIPMESHGIPVDVEALESALAEINTDLDLLETQIQAKIAPLLTEFNEWFLNKEFSPKRTGEFAQIVIEMLGPNLLPRTKTGSYSMVEKAVSKLPEGLLRDWLQEKCNLPADIVRQVQARLQSGTAFNLLSKHHLKKLFFDKLKETPISTTDLGSPQVDEEFLELMAAKYDWAGQLIVYNKLTKIKGTYIERFLAQHEDGTFYPSFQQHRTISGRYGSDLQQLSRPLEEGSADPLVIKHNNRIRQFFKCKGDLVFVGADYESLEPKVFSHVSTDPKVQEIFHKGYDFYSHIAIMTEGLQGVSADKKADNYLGKVNKGKRQQAKPYSLGIPYGMSGYKLAFELNIDKEDANQLVENYLAAFPDLHEWMQDTAAKVYTHGFINVETGRKRRFPRAVKIYNEYGDAILHDLKLWKKYHQEPYIYEQAKKARREFKNYINNGNNIQIQGLAASIVNRASIKINRALRDAHLNAQIVLQIHDELVCICHERDSAKVAAIMQKCMENVYSLAVPLKAEPQIAKSYGDTK